MRALKWLEEIVFVVSLVGTVAMLGAKALQPYGEYGAEMGICAQVIAVSLVLALASGWKGMPIWTAVAAVLVVLVEQAIVVNGMIEVGPAAIKGSPLPELSQVFWWLLTVSEPIFLLCVSGLVEMHRVRRVAG